MRQPEVRIFATAEAALEPALRELGAAVAGGGTPLVSFATGATYAAFFARLQPLLAGGALGPGGFCATHLDEYQHCAPGQPGGMVHELLRACPAFADLLPQGRFLPVPAAGDPASLRAHEAALAARGGVALQFLGIGRNGHLAFNEPGTPFDLGFHVTALAATTRDDARVRFQPRPVPTHAVTAGIASILSARRLVLCAFGAAKAAAVAAMLRGEVGPQCPASALRRHGNALVLLDRQAAQGLGAGATCTSP